MDTLDSVFPLIRLDPRVLFRSNLPEHWGVSDAIKQKTIFHVIETGSCFLRVNGERELISLSEGDVVVLSNLDSYEMMDSEATRTIPFSQAVQFKLSGTIDLSGGSTSLVCGGFHPTNESTYPLSRFLPAVVKIKREDRNRAREIFENLDRISRELNEKRDGFETVVARLLEIVFVMVIRYCFSHTEGESGNVIAGLAHPQLGATLNELHKKPGEEWTLERMASTAAMSKSHFSERFTAVVGMAPMAYLTAMRIQLASFLLAENQSLTLDEVAGRVGYSSGFAFSKAFKRSMDVSPKEYRKRKSNPGVKFYV